MERLKGVQKGIGLGFPKRSCYIFKKFFYTSTQGFVYHGRKQKDVWVLDITPKAVALGQQDIYQHTLLRQITWMGSQMGIYLNSFSNNIKYSSTGELLTVLAICII